MNVMLLQEGYPYAIIQKEERLDYLNSLAEVNNFHNFNDLYSPVFK